MTISLRNLFTWRTAIIHSDLPSTTRHVLLTLSLHMNEVGGSCFPATKTLASETGLSERAVCTHLANANESGWLKKQTRKTGNAWKSTEYFAAVPSKFMASPGTERGSVPTDPGTERGSVRGTEPNDTPVLNEVQSNSTTNSTDINATNATPPIEDLFEKVKPLKGAVTITTYIQHCKKIGVKAIPENAEVFNYAENAGIPVEFLHLCWREFVERHAETGKKQKSWPLTFKNYVRNNYYELWAVTRDGEYFLTAKGKQAEILHNKNRATA